VCARNNLCAGGQIAPNGQSAACLATLLELARDGWIKSNVAPGRWLTAERRHLDGTVEAMQSSSPIVSHIQNMAVEPRWRREFVWSRAQKPDDSHIAFFRGELVQVKRAARRHSLWRGLIDARRALRTAPRKLQCSDHRSHALAFASQCSWQQQHDEVLQQIVQIALIIAGSRVV
jgi:hypothetical protein